MRTTWKGALVSWLILVSTPAAALAIPELVWLDASGPWTSGPGASTNFSGGGLVEETAIGNTFMVTGAASPVVLRWRVQAYGLAVALGGDTPWDAARLDLWGLGWIDEGTEDPWDVSSATKLWEHSVSFGPPSGPDVYFGGAFGPFVTLFTVQPDTIYTLKQWNFSKLNYFDVGYFNATLSSEVTLVPEPASGLLMLAGLGLMLRLTPARRLRSGTSPET